MKLIKAFTALAATGILFVAAGCIGAGSIRADQYVYLEHYVETQGVLVSDPSADAYAYMGYPTYNISASQGLLKASQFPTLNGSLKALLGEGQAIGKAGCHGGRMSLYGIYDLPYAENNITIRGIDEKGIVYLDYGGKALTLAPGGTWYENSSRIETIYFKNGAMDEYVRVNVSVTDRIANYGIIKKPS